MDYYQMIAVYPVWRNLPWFHGHFIKWEHIAKLMLNRWVADYMSSYANV